MKFSLVACAPESPFAIWHLRVPGMTLDEACVPGALDAAVNSDGLHKGDVVYIAGKDGVRQVFVRTPRPAILVKVMA